MVPVKTVEAFRPILVCGFPSSLGPQIKGHLSDTLDNVDLVPLFVLHPRIAEPCI